MVRLNGPVPFLSRALLGTGRLTTGRIMFLDKVWEIELRIFSEEKKQKQNIVGILIPLTGQCNYH